MTAPIRLIPVLLLAGCAAAAPRPPDPAPAEPEPEPLGFGPRVDWFRREPSESGCVREFLAYLRKRPGPALLRWSLGEILTVKDPRLLATVIEKVVESDPKGQHAFAMTMALKYLRGNPAIAAAAIRAVGRHASRSTVEDLRNLLQWAAGADREKGPCGLEIRTAVIECLQRLTGYREAKDGDFESWWWARRVTWRPPDGTSAAEDTGERTGFDDPVAGIRFAGLDRRWFWRYLDDFDLLRISTVDDGQEAAWILLSVADHSRNGIESPRTMAAEWVARMRCEFSDVASVTPAEPCVVGGLPGFQACIEGQHRDYERVRIRALFADDGRKVYRVTAWSRKGRRTTLVDETDAVIRALRFGWN